ncbi:MAG: ABC transporter ATP-binding protein/permease [Akkermansiaceae bacterium]|jgi:putative ATP-binding cassette transporter|nr:ABC transporter ATP-binding protein/permease [Akkermansiaceae bacterium]MBJ7284144.1 ABC transporter ATP-binding protein/permease [Akkermansiaceae bacterium]MBJ7395013.1 ABC transporter ATP-binding protein/permease [Akkermansiaceae bacterium]MBJ7423837.1 ABC transporter ATP-binding protein/permease [Akkermansiaceae bacterium]
MPIAKLLIIRLTWKRLRGVLRTLVRSDQGPKAVMFAVTLIILMFAINGLNVVNSFVGRYFMSAIENRNEAMFQKQALYYVGVFLASTVVLVFYRFTEERLGILWREQLTRRLTDAYMKDRTYYRLDSATGVANPDQRISEDVRAFTTTTLSFVLLIVNGTLTALSFSGVLWTISPQLFGVAVAYAAVGSVLTIYLGKPLIRLNYDQLDMEADFRSDLIHVRENSESIALAHREGRFKARLNKRLDALATNFRRLIRINRNLGFFTNGYNYFIQIIPALMIAPLFISGNKEFGVITQSTMAFATLVGAFSLIVTQFQSISAFTAVVARLHTLSDAIEKTQRTALCMIEVEESPDRVVYENVTIHSADWSRLLISELNMEITRGSRWLVVGKDDAPKVALFRATAGVWSCGDGRIIRPNLDDILFLPERPYIPPGTLREALLRTGMELITPDSEIMEVLEKLGLSDVVTHANGLDTNQDWDDLLSIGEQHLLSVSRIFLAKPAFVFLDRPGSALAKNQIASILDMLKEQGTGVVILSKNGESRLRYDAVLEIMPNGAWEVRRELPADGADLQDLSC